MWERWDGWTPDKGFQGPGMDLFNHYAFGSVGQWIFATIAGIEADSPGFQQFSIRPIPGGGLKFARASYRSIHGTISTNWQLQGGKFHLDIVVPPDATAKVYVPCIDIALIKKPTDIKCLGQRGGYAIFK